MQIDQHIQAARREDLTTLRRVEQTIVDFIAQHLTDEHGLLWSHLHAQTLKPWTKEQIAAQSPELDFYDVRRGDAVGQLAYEDSLMATGEFALSRILKFRATGDEVALHHAAAPIHALLRVLEEGAKYERGYLPKPHGGLLRAAYSHEISVDQYIKTITALRAWQPHASLHQRNLIDEHLVAMADYHLIRNFAHPRRESMIVTPENRTHGIALFIPLLALAHRISGDARYCSALARFDPIVQQLVAGPVPTNCNIVSLFIEGFDLALREGHDDARLRDLIVKLWHARVADTRKLGLWNDDPGDTFSSSRAIRIAAFAPIVDHHAPAAEAWRLAIALLRNRTDPLQFRYADADPDALISRQRYRARSICETSLTSWLVAYWELQWQFKMQA